MQILSRQARKVITDNKWRYLSLIAGFFLFVAPFALLTRLIYRAIGNSATPTLHTFCYRMPLDWLFGGRVSALWGSVAAALVLGVIVLSYFAGPVFCGWLCPVGAVSEGVSRFAPLPEKLRMRIRDSRVASAMRFGFLAGFVSISVLVGYRLATGTLGSIACRLCASSVLQNFASAMFGQQGALDYWHTGSIVAMAGWLGLGGIFLSGGRGWCLFFCPLGAASNLAHRLGAWRGWLATRFEKSNCVECPECVVTCPMLALRPDRTVDRNLCMNCYECTHSCISGAYRCGLRKEHGLEFAIPGRKALENAGTR